MTDATAQRKPEVHVFEMRGQWFVLDVVGNELFSISEGARARLDDTWSGQAPSVESFAEFKIQKELEALLSTIRSHEGRQAPLQAKCEGWSRESLDVMGLWLGLSHACNLACVYCFANEPRYLKSNQFMSWETAKSAIDFLMARSPERETYEIIFFGGEPLLRFDVLQQVVAYCESFHEKGKHFDFSMTTNGTLLTPEVFSYCEKHDVSIMLSIDGTKELHDRSRPYRGGKPSWDDIVTNLQRLPGFERSIKARVTVPNTKVPLLEIYKTMKAIGFESVSLVEVCPNSGEMPAFPEEELATWKTQHLELAEYILETEPDCYEHGLNNLSGFARALREGERSYYCCGTGIHYFYVTPQGDCYPCMRLITEDERNKMGSIHSGIDMDLVRRFQSNHIFNKSCRTCWARFLCGGMCYGDSFAVTGDIRNLVATTCELTRHKIEVAAYLVWRLRQEGRLDPEKKQNWGRAVLRSLLSRFQRRPEER